MSDGDRRGQADPGSSLAAPGHGLAGTEPAALLNQPFTEATVTALRHAVTAKVAQAGVTGNTAEDFVLAVNELMTNAVRHGGGSGRLELRMMADVVVCDVIDHGEASDNLPVQLCQVDQPGGRGLWLAHQLTGSLMLTRRPDGVTATVSICVTEQPTPPNDQPNLETHAAGTQSRTSGNENP